MGESAYTPGWRVMRVIESYRKVSIETLKNTRSKILAKVGWRFINVYPYIFIALQQLQLC